MKKDAATKLGYPIKFKQKICKWYFDGLSVVSTKFKEIPQKSLLDTFACFLWDKLLLISISPNYYELQWQNTIQHAKKLKLNSVALFSLLCLNKKVLRPQYSYQNYDLGFWYTATGFSLKNIIVLPN